MASLRVTREAVADYLLGDYVSYAFRHTLRRLVSAPPDCPREDRQTGERYSAYQLRNVRSEVPFLAGGAGAILGEAICRAEYLPPARRHLLPTTASWASSCGLHRRA